MKRTLSACLLVLLTTAALEAQDSRIFVDPRSLELVRLDCTTGVVRSEMTLFGNGTLRLREGDVGEEALLLTELLPDVLEAYQRRLQLESMGNSLAPPKQVDGLWTEQCVLTLDVPDGPAGTAAFSVMDSLSLPLSRVVAIARELLTLARAETRVTGIPRGYVPERGDILVHHDGSRYRVHGWTSDGTGVELLGIEQPMALYVLIDSLHEQFLGLAEEE